MRKIGLHTGITLGLSCVLLWMIGTPAYASHCWQDHNGSQHCTPSMSRFDTKTQTMIRSGLIGAGIGAGAGVLLGKPLLHTAVLGAGIGVGSQAIHNSHYMAHHPIVKTAAYGALAGAGVSGVSRETSLLKGALVGGAIGGGVGTLKHAY